MRVIDLMKTYAPEHDVVFEYCYYDRDMKPEVEEALSYRGKAGDFEAVMAEKNPQALFCYATCGESYDFEVVEDSDAVTIFRYIDFR